MTGYIRQSTVDIQDGEIITAGPLNNEFNQLDSAFAGITGHPHDGSTGNGPKINLTSAVTGILPVINGGTGLTNLSTLTLISTDAGATAAPVLNLDRDSASPAVSDILGIIQFNGNSSTLADRTYAQIYPTINDPVDGTEDATLNFNTITAGAMTTGLSITGLSTKIPATGKIDFGAGDITVTHTTNTLSFAGAASGYIFDTNIIPLNNGGQDIGSITKAWDNLYLKDTTGTITFGPGASNIILSAATGTLTLQGSFKINGGLLDLSHAASGQIKFPAAQNASANVNTLDDYEEGTWTPVMTSTTGTITTIGTSVGAYTKVGNVMNIRLTIIVTTNGTGAGFLQISGLPYTSAAAGRWTLSGREQAVNFKSLAGSLTSGSTTITNISNYDGTYPGVNSATIVISGSYFTD